MENKIKTFIEENKLNFNTSSSTLNSNCLVISGYALYCGITEYDDLLKIILDNDDHESVQELKHELKTVFDFAKKDNYGLWWEKPEAKEQYIF